MVPPDTPQQQSSLNYFSTLPFLHINDDEATMMKRPVQEAVLK
jgi:hypothetical protein